MDSVITSVREIQGRVREDRQAAARPAHLRYVVSITGNGESRVSIRFSTACLEEPSFTFGMQAVTRMPVGHLPLGGAIVLDWRIERDLWRGVDMGFRVDSYIMNPKVKFWLVFEATALRSTHGI